MMKPLCLFALLAATAACSTSSGSGGHSATAPGGAKGEEVKLTGVLTPAVFEAVSLWPEVYTGELLVLEVLPHGSSVNAGEVVAELDKRPIEEKLADAELDLNSTRIRHAGLLEKNRIAAESAAARLELAEASVNRAERSLEGYLKHERKFTERSDELSQRREASWESDQLDELEQLEAMYDADELVDATEEIVLKRQRRDVAMTQASNELTRDRRSYRVDLTDELQAEIKREDVARKARDLAHLRRTQSVEAMAREDAEHRSSAELSKKEKALARLQSDLGLLSVRAPRAGILMHGSPRVLRKGASASQLERGSRLTPRSDVFVVADPARLAVALDVPESMLAQLTNGATVTVRPVGSTAEMSGTVTLASFPTGSKGEESTFEATVELSEAAAGLIPGLHAAVEAGGAQ